MIEITADIIGPGIDEEYADALTAISQARAALGPETRDNNSPEEQVLMSMERIEQQIRAGSLPIPADPGRVGVIFYLVGSNDLGNYPGFQHALGRLWLVLKGYGLMKQRHVPVLIAMMDDFIRDAEACPSVAGAQALIADMRKEVDLLRGGGAWPRERRPQDQFMVQLPPGLNDCMDRGFSRVSDIDAALFEAWRPRPARKPPLAGPYPE